MQVRFKSENGIITECLCLLAPISNVKSYDIVCVIATSIPAILYITSTRRRIDCDIGSMPRACRKRMRSAVVQADVVQAIPVDEAVVEDTKFRISYVCALEGGKHSSSSTAAVPAIEIVQETPSVTQNPPLPPCFEYCILCGDTSHVYICNAVAFIKKTIAFKKIIPGPIVSDRVIGFLENKITTHPDVVCMSCAYHLRRVRNRFMFPLDMYLTEVMMLSSHLETPDVCKKRQPERGRIMDARCRRRIEQVLQNPNNPYFHSMPEVLQTIVRSSHRVLSWWKSNLFTQYFSSASAATVVRHSRKGMYKSGLKYKMRMCDKPKWNYLFQSTEDEDLDDMDDDEQ